MTTVWRGSDAPNDRALGIGFDTVREDDVEVLGADLPPLLVGWILRPKEGGRPHGQQHEVSCEAHGR
jgi:hypothetical protein